MTISVLVEPEKPEELRAGRVPPHFQIRSGATAHSTVSTHKYAEVTWFFF